MEGRGAQVAHDCVLGLDNRHGNLLLRQQQRDAEPDRPAAGDDHLGVAGAGDRGGMRWMCGVACHIVALPSRGRVINGDDGLPVAESGKNNNDRRIRAPRPDRRADAAGQHDRRAGILGDAAARRRDDQRAHDERQGHARRAAPGLFRAARHGGAPVPQRADRRDRARHHRRILCRRHPARARGRCRADQEDRRAVHHRRPRGGARAQHAEGASASASSRPIPRV